MNKADNLTDEYIYMHIYVQVGVGPRLSCGRVNNKGTRSRWAEKE